MNDIVYYNKDLANQFPDKSGKKILTPVFSFSAFRYIYNKWSYQTYKRERTNEYVKVKDQELIRFCQEAGIEYGTTKNGTKTDRLLKLGDLYFFCAFYFLRSLKRDLQPKIYQEVKPFFSNISELSSIKLIFNRESANFIICYNAVYSHDSFRKSWYTIDTTEINSIIVNAIDSRLFVPVNTTQSFYWSTDEEEMQCGLTKLFSQYLPSMMYK